MKKLAFVVILGTPLLYIYGLLENHFSFNNSVRGYSFEFYKNWLNAWRILFGKKDVDYSVEINNYEFKVQAKKAKIDVELVMFMKELYGTWSIKLDRKRNKLIYSVEQAYGYKTINIIQVRTDHFKLNYMNDSAWNASVWLNSDYLLTKEQVIDIIKYLEAK